MTSTVPPYSVRKGLREATLRVGRSKRAIAAQIADAITANCNAYEAQRIDRAAWDAEQNRLWKVAADNLVVSAVMALVCPK